MQEIRGYIDRIMEVADLARRDERRVRGELEFHVQEMLDAGRESGLSEVEVMAMIEKEFGDQTELGKMIARAKGRFRTYLKKQARTLPIALAIAVVLALGVRAVAFEAFRVTTDAASPVVPKGSRVLVNKLTGKFDVNDVIVFRHDGHAMVGVVRQADRQKEGSWSAGRIKMIPLSKETKSSARRFCSIGVHCGWVKSRFEALYARRAPTGDARTTRRGRLRLASYGRLSTKCRGEVKNSRGAISGLW